MASRPLLSTRRKLGCFGPMQVLRLLAAQSGLLEVPLDPVDPASLYVALAHRVPGAPARRTATLDRLDRAALPGARFEQQVVLALALGRSSLASDALKGAVGMP